MQRIIPCLWFDGRVQEAAKFYAEVFGGEIIRTDHYTDAGKEEHGHNAGDVLTVEVVVDGSRIVLLNGGAYFTMNPSISLSVARSTADQVNELCAKLLEGGKELMPVDKYPFSERYGWIQDKFGMSWQVSLGEPSVATPSLLFTQDKAGNAEAAMNFYTSVFPGSSVGMIARYPEGSASSDVGTVMYGEVMLFGQKVTAMDSSMDHKFVFSEGISLMVECDTQMEIDKYWNQLSAVPESEQCGWLKDKYGVSWQISPVALNDMLKNGTQQQIEKVTTAFMQMKKFDVAELERVYSAVA